MDGVTQYTYDALGQLLTETVNGTLVASMTYDNYGNILTKGSNTYTYGDSVWKDRLTAFNGQAISYDAQGNPTSYRGKTLTWEKGRQLKSYGSYSYTYNANGFRTSKTVSGVKHTYTLDGTKILKETWGSTSLTPLYDNEDEVCGILYNSTPYYFLKNLQGDVIAITNKSGEVVARYTYDAWGKVLSVKSASGTVITSSTNVANVNPFRYRGYYYDTETSLYYLQSRYYDPDVARFINADDAEYLGTDEIAVMCNLFTYCNNDCIMNSDPSGYLSLNMKSLGKKYWLAKFISIFASNITDRGKNICVINLRWVGIKLALKAIAGTSPKIGSFFTVSKNKLSCSLGGISFSSGSGKIGLSVSGSFFSVTLKAFVELTKSAVIFGFSFTHSIVQNKKRVYYGVALSISISYWTLAFAAASIAAACFFVPAFVPVASKLVIGMGRLISNPRRSLLTTAKAAGIGMRLAAGFH